MKDFMDKVAAYVALYNAAINIGIDITEQVVNKIKSDSAKLLVDEHKTFTVFYNDRTQTREMPSLNAAEVADVRNKRKLEAVRQYRDRTGFALMESKQAIDQFCYNHDIK